MTTTAEYAVFCAHVYKTRKSPPLPPGWREWLCSIPSRTGFYAQAYENPTSQEIVIAFRGTNGERGNLLAVAAVFFGRKSRQFNEALYFYTYLKRAVPAANISLAGHSLGGAEAQYVSALTGVYAETFAAPGIRRIKGLQDLSADVTNHMIAGDLIALFGEHVGRVHICRPHWEQVALGACTYTYKLLAGFGLSARRRHPHAIRHFCEHLAITEIVAGLRTNLQARMRVDELGFRVAFDAVRPPVSRKRNHASYKRNL